jgi:hypothetical protein
MNTKNTPSEQGTIPTLAHSAPAGLVSRRSIMNMLVSTSAVTLGAVPAHSQEIADAELLRLGAEFGIAWGEVSAALDRFNDLHSDVEEAAERDCPDLPDNQNCWTRNDAIRWHEAMKRAESSAGQPYHDAYDALNAADGHLDALIRKINGIKPTTIAGAGVRARAAMPWVGDWWGDDNLDYPEEVCRSLIQAICAGAGLPTDPDPLAQKSAA